MLIQMKKENSYHRLFRAFLVDSFDLLLSRGLLSKYQANILPFNSGPEPPYDVSSCFSTCVF